MTIHQAQELLDKIVGQVFGYQNPYKLGDFIKKFAFDIKLPQEVIDSIDGKKTWAQSVNPTRFVSLSNARNLNIGGASKETDYLRPKRQIDSIQELTNAWNEINFTTTERYKDCINVSESDNIQYSENIYRSQDIQKSKNVLLTDGLNGSEFIAASQRSSSSTFCIRLEDSIECTNCFTVSWSVKLVNCFFMHDCADMQDSMFCTNIKGKQYCVANMQYSEAEYNKIKDMVMRWLLSS